MTKKKSLTLEEHTALGKELQTMRDQLVTISTQIGNAYGVKAGEAAEKGYWPFDKPAFEQLKEFLRAISAA